MFEPGAQSGPPRVGLGVGSLFARDPSDRQPCGIDLALDLASEA